MFVVEPALADFVAAAERTPRVMERLRWLREIEHLGAATPVGLRECAHALFGDAVVHGYGASELGPVSTTIGHPFNARAAGYNGVVAQTVAINPALAINGIEIMNQWYYRPNYMAIMSNCACTQMGVWSENSLDRTVVVAVYGQPA